MAQAVCGLFARHDAAAGAALEVAGVASVGAVRLYRRAGNQRQGAGVLRAAEDGVAHLKDLATVDADLVAGVAAAGADRLARALNSRTAAVGAGRKPGNKAYGILSVLIQAWYDVEYLFTVDEGVFNPPPKVKSAVIRMTRNNSTNTLILIS